MTQITKNLKNLWLKTTGRHDLVIIQTFLYGIKMVRFFCHIQKYSIRKR